MTAKGRLFSLLVLSGCGGRYVDGMCQWPLEVGCEQMSCPTLATALESWRDCEEAYALFHCTAGGDVWWIVPATEEVEVWEAQVRRFWGPDGEVVAVTYTVDYSHECDGESAFTDLYGEIPACTEACAYERCEVGGTVALATGEGACPAGTEPPGVEPP